MIGTNPSLEALEGAFQEWIDAHSEDHARLKTLPYEYGDRYAPLCELQNELFDAGWARYGWPEEHGGLGGTVLHRALVLDLLARNGYPARHFFEHLEILPPALSRFAQPELAKELIAPTLRGDVLWCQGFSEPTAGSDLANLKTTARRTDEGYRLDGHKIWTTWAGWSTHLLVLARTGDQDSRHRGISAFVTPLDVPGLEVGKIRQANQHDELAEVFLDNVLVPEANRLGEEGDGWAVAMYILAGERGSFAWMRSNEVFVKLERIAAQAESDHDIMLGESYAALQAVRARTRPVLEMLSRGESPGPESSVTKAALIDMEQRFYDSVRSIQAGTLDLGTCEDMLDWQERYLYSRAGSIYGGARPIQLNVIAKQLIASDGQIDVDATEEEALMRESVASAIEQSERGRDALEGLDFWSFAANPEDSFGQTAFATWFEEQGRALATSPALGGIYSAPAAEKLGVAPENMAAGWPARGGDDRLHVVGFEAGKTTHIAVAAEGGFQVYSASDAKEVSSGAFDTGLVGCVTISAASSASSASPASPARAEHVPVAADALARAHDLALIAAALELGGATAALLEAAVQHTKEREQFGKPLSALQSVQHLHAESHIEVSTARALSRAALEQWSAGDAHAIARSAKLFAGRTGLRVTQRALQCFGAIGFTDEHVHHLYSRRLHTLDALLSTADALARSLGENVRETGHADRGIDIYRPAESAEA
ncbi:MAG: acyl-CoA dehydrogenase family protein [Myxococcota bacterium]